MKITELESTIEKIINSIHSATGTKVFCDIRPSIDAAKFPDDLLDKMGNDKIGNDKDGLYVFSEKKSGIIHYVGISIDVKHRFETHIGTGVNWERNGVNARFPNCKLVSGKEQWLLTEIKEIFENARFNVTFIIPDNKRCKALIEQYLIFYASVVTPQELICINVN